MKTTQKSVRIKQHAVSWRIIAWIGPMHCKRPLASRTFDICSTSPREKHGPALTVLSLHQCTGLQFRTLNMREGILIRPQDRNFFPISQETQATTSHVRLQCTIRCRAIDPHHQRSVKAALLAGSCYLHHTLHHVPCTLGLHARTFSKPE